MSKKIEVLKNAISLLEKFPELDVEVTIKIPTVTVSDKIEEKKVIAKKDIEKEPVKPKSGSQTVDEFDSTLNTEKKNTVKPDPKKTGEKSSNPSKSSEIGTAEAAKEEPKEPKKVILQEGQEHCIACGGTGKNSKGGSCVPCKGTGIKQEEKAKEEPKEEPVKEEPDVENNEEDTDDDWDF